MVLGVNQSIGLIVVIISVIAYFTVKNSLIHSNDSVRDLSDNENDLLIAITSAQEHFEQRISIRRTWLKSVKSERLKYYFLIGKLFCPIPPKYRQSSHSCEEWKPLLSHKVTNETIFNTITKNNICFTNTSEHNVYTKGFTFILNNKIIIHQFGIDSRLLRRCNDSVQLVLFDAVTANRIVSSTFSVEGDESVDVTWKKIPRVILPSGFEGKLLLEGNCSKNQNDNKHASLSLDDRSSIIRFLLYIDSKSRLKPYTSNMCTNIGFSFSIKDVDSIRNLIDNRSLEQKKWESYLNDVSNRLNNEIITYGDILFLDVIDVYQNLPRKMLQFYKWLDYNEYEYILKTDDDVFVDVPNVIREIRMNTEYEWSWWSCFRINWPVQRAGKWREMYLNLTTYPIFPSGAGYVLNKNIIKYINENIKQLSLNIQGEDVALGVWLQNFNSSMHSGFHCQWSCNDHCLQGACNIMELSVSDMLSVWEKYLSCNYSLNCLCK